MSQRDHGKKRRSDKACVNFVGYMEALPYVFRHHTPYQFSSIKFNNQGRSYRAIVSVYGDDGWYVSFHDGAEMFTIVAALYNKIMAGDYDARWDKFKNKQFDSDGNFG